MHIAASAMTTVPRSALAARPDTTAEIVARPFVRELLERAPAFRALSGDAQHALAANMVAVAAHLARPADLASRASALLQAVDFPSFVGGLINGVFHVIVDASVKQMEAYAELVRTAAESLDEFARDNVSDDQARDQLAQRCPDLLLHDTTQPLCRRSLIAAMMTLGIARIMSGS